MNFTSLLNTIKNDKNEVYMSKNTVIKKENFANIQLIILFIIVISYLVLNHNILL